MLVGDDYQLPPVVIKGKGKGEFHVFENYDSTQYYPAAIYDEARGNELFKILATTVMELNHRIRQENDSNMITVVDDIEKGQPSLNTIERLIKLTMSYLPHNIQKDIIKKATYIFAMNLDKNNHNNHQLLNICSETNPMACLSCHNIYSQRKCIRRHYDKSTPLKTHICVGARVEIKGKNIEPSWGIYNGAIGTVREIVFGEDKNPNLGDLPLYVAVELSSNKPPSSIKPFDSLNPKVSVFYIYSYFKNYIIHSFLISFVFRLYPYL